MKYEDDKYIFYKLRETDNYIWGNFYNKENEKETTTYILVNKSNRKLQALNNDYTQIIVY